MAKSIKKTFISGTFWTASENIIFTVIGIIQLYVTSKLLSPEDFGIYAVALFFSTLGTTAFSMGLGPALIQKKGDISEYINIAWTANICIASLASLILVFSAPLICEIFFKNKAAIWPAIVIMLSVVLSAGISPVSVYSQKKIELKKYFYMQTVPKICSFVILIVCVYYTRSFWALIIALLSEYIIRFFYSYILFPCKPKFDFNKKKFVELYSFGGWLQLKNVCQWLASHLDVAVVGNLLGPYKLGLFNRSQSLSGYPRTFINGVINSVAFPLFSKTIHERKPVQKIVNKIFDITLITLGAMALLVLLFSVQVIDIVLGAKWIVMAESFKWLFISYLLDSLLLSFNPILRSFGRTKNEFTFYTVKIVSLLICLYPLTYYYDLMGTSVAMIVSQLVTFPYMLNIVKKKTSINLAPIINSIIIVLVAVIVTYYLFCFFTPTGLYWILYYLLSCMVFAVVLVLVSKILGYGPGNVLMETFLDIAKFRRKG